MTFLKKLICLKPYSIQQQLEKHGNGIHPTAKSWTYYGFLDFMMMIPGLIMLIVPYLIGHQSLAVFEQMPNTELITVCSMWLIGLYLTAVRFIILIADPSNMMSKIAHNK